MIENAQTSPCMQWEREERGGREGGKDGENGETWGGIERYGDGWEWGGERECHEKCKNQ